MNVVKSKIIYFHGYGSSSDSSKVKMMRDYGLDVQSWDINVDPAISIPYLEEKILDFLIENIGDYTMNLIFIGSSLGAWYAATLGNKFGAKSILINPSYDPQTTLKNRHNLDDYILERYSPIIFDDTHTVYIGKNDEVIDFRGVNFNGAKVHYVEGADHRFIDHFHYLLENEFPTS